jgi:hypothetical protein
VRPALTNNVIDATDRRRFRAFAMLFDKQVSGTPDVEIGSHAERP